MSRLMLFDPNEILTKEEVISILRGLMYDINKMPNANPSYWVTCDVVDRADLKDLVQKRIDALGGEE